MVLSTLGYQGTTLQEFINTLKKNNIKILIDVRENPISRKKGFSKNTLREAIINSGIDYYHYCLLGSKREMRKRYHETNDWNWFSEQYKDYLNTQTEEIDRLVELFSKGHCCLMCFEADYELCHRSIITDFIHKELNSSIEIRHLTVV